MSDIVFRGHSRRMKSEILSSFYRKLLLTMNSSTFASDSAAYRLDKAHSQSTVVSSELSNQSSSNSTSQGKKGWPNACVKQSVSSRNSSKPDSIYRKPSHSYSSLISEAIKMSTKGQMTLNEIYCWLIEKFPYFRGAGTGWKVNVVILTNV